MLKLVILKLDQEYWVLVQLLIKKKDKQIDEENIEDRLSYVNGAFLEILVGKHANKYAQLVSFDDGLGKIIVKLVDDN